MHLDQDWVLQKFFSISSEDIIVGNFAALVRLPVRRCDMIGDDVQRAIDLLLQLNSQLDGQVLATELADLERI